MSDDEQMYVLERLHEVLSEAQLTNDSESEEEATEYIAAVQQHRAAHGFSPAKDPVRCEACGEAFPCSVLKLHARQWRGREDFPKHLL